MTATIRDQILTRLSLHGRMLPRVLSDVVASHPGCEDQLAVNAEIVRLIDAGLVEVDGAYLCHVEPERTEEEDLAAYFRAADNYRAQMARRRGFWSWVGVKITIAWEKFLAAWDRIWPGIVLIIATSGFALGLCAQEGHWTTAEVTAYCPCAICCGTFDRITANNTSTDRVPYAFAADRSLPFGTRVYVPAGLGVLDIARADDRWLVVDDRGGALDTEARRYRVLRLDLRVRDHSWAVRFGRRVLPVFLVSP